jgi:membrane protease YdiL (CAAX protease family)
MKIGNANGKYIGASRHAFYVTLAFVLLSMVPGLLVPGAKPFAYIPPLVYILRERRIRGRSWEEIGIKVRGIRKDFLTNWHLFFIVAVVLQLPVILIARAFWPDLLKHISSRVPLLNSSSIGLLIFIIIVIPFLEELIYRGLLQQRLAWYLNGFVAVVIASIVFALQHFTAGSPAIVAVDLAGVFVDGMFYGWIFSRCRNVLVSWSAHTAADFVSAVLLLFLV